MSTMTPAAVYTLARTAGLTPAAAAIATAIAISESGLRTDVMGDVSLETGTWGPSVGLWQIRSVKSQTGTGGTRDVNSLTDPAFNARSMVEISGTGKSFTPWSTYTSGRYRDNLTKVSSATAGGAAEPAPGATSSTPAPAGVLDPFTNWVPNATGLGLKLGLVGAGAVLVILGAWRLVIPAAAGNLSEAIS